MTSLAVSIDIGAVLKDGFATAFSQAGTMATKLDKAIAAVDTRIATMDGWRAAKKETAAAREEWEKATAKAKGLAAQLAATANPTEDLKNKVAAARKEADQAKAAFQGAATGLRAMDTQMKAAGVSIKTVKTEMDAAERSMAALTARREKLSAAMSAKLANDQARSALKGQVLETVGQAGALAVPVIQAVQFETAMGDVRKAVDFDAAGPGLKGMERTVKDLARDIPIVHEGLAAIVAAGGRMGIAEKDLKTYTVTVAKMSTAWEMAPDAAGDSMGKIANIYGLAIDKLELVGDAINKLDDSSTAKAPEIVDVLKRTGGTGKQFGLTVQQNAALATAMLDLGSSSEVAGTAINALLGKLQSAPVQTSKFQGALEDLGWSAEDMQNAIGRDAQGTLTKFLETLSKLDKNTQVNALGELFGAEYSDDMAKLVGGLETYRKHLKTVGDEANYAGSMNEEFNKRSELTSNQLVLTKNAFTELGINIGTVLLPAVRDIAQGLAVATHGLASFAEAHPAVTKAIVFATAAFVTFKVVKLASAFAYLTLKGAALAANVQMTRTAAAATIATTSMRGFSMAGMVGGFRAGAATLLAFAGRPIAAVLGGLKAIRIATMLNPLGLLLTGLSFAATMVIEHWDKVWKVVKIAIDWVSKALDAIPLVGAAIKWVVGDDGPDAGPASGVDTGAAVNDNAANDNGLGFDAERAAAAGAGVAPGGGRPVYQINGGVTIYVQQQPGQSPEATAGAVKKAFQDSVGGALYDK